MPLYLPKGIIQDGGGRNSELSTKRNNRLTYIYDILQECEQPLLEVNSRWQRTPFLCATARNAKRVLAIVILSVCLSWPSTDSSPREIETPGFYCVIAQCLKCVVTKFGAAGSGDSPRTRASKRGTPTLRNRYFTAIGSSSMKTVADRHRLAAYHNKHCWRAFQWYQHRWPWTTLNPKYGFLDF